MNKVVIVLNSWSQSISEGFSEFWKIFVNWTSSFFLRRLIIASLHLYANKTDSMEDSIEALHELMHFFYSGSTASSGMYKKHIFP